MRVLVVILALVVVGAAVPPADASVSSSSAVFAPAAVAAGNSTAASGEKMIDVCLMTCFNVDKSTLSELRSQGLSNSDIAVACAIATNSGTPLRQVVAEYLTCRDWPQVAKNHRLSMSDLMNLPMMADADVETFNRTFIVGYYSIPESDVAQMRKNGLDWGEICMIANAAARTGQSPKQIATMRKQGMSWAQIAEKYNISRADITKPVRPLVVAVTTPPQAGAGPQMPCLIYNQDGQIVLTLDQALWYYKRGYDWLDVAVAANIASVTGYPISFILQLSKTGATWQDLIYKFGVGPDTAFNVCNYPFPRRTIYSERVNQMNMNAIAQYQKPVCPPTGPCPTAPCAPCEPCVAPCEPAPCAPAPCEPCP